MEYRTLGATGIQLSPLGLGTLNFGRTSDDDEAVRIVHRAIDAGINYIDTADCYNGGRSEDVVRKALAGRRDEVILGSKFTLPMGDAPNMRGHSRVWILRAVEASLKRLGVDHLDLYQAHRIDPTTDLDELLGTLSDLVHQGKVRTIGTSNFPAHVLVEAHWVSERRGRERIRSEQLPYSIFARGVERDVLPVCQKYGMGVICFSPLNYGWLSGKSRASIEEPTEGRAMTMAQKFDLALLGNRRKLDLLGELEALAAEAGLPLIQLALAFVTQHPAVTAAVVGPRTVEQLEGQLPALELDRLDSAILDRIDELVPPGTTLVPGDAVYVPPSLEQPALRRRP